MEQLSVNNFKEKTSKGLVLVDFSASWCGPCRMLAPVLEQVSTAVKGKAEVFKADVDELEDAAREFGVMSVPCMVLLKDGKEVDRMVGLTSKDNIVRLIHNYML